MATSPNKPALDRLVETWDTAIGEFLDGAGSVPAELEPWFSSYAGRGLGAVEPDAMPEPFIGPLTGSPEMVFLAVNPGRAFDFQRRDGFFAERVLDLGSYSNWAATWPYIDGDWETAAKRPNPHHKSRLKFMRRWLEDDNKPAEAMVAFELYPWHSTRVTATMRPDPGIVREYVWEPIAELGAPLVFAFGAPWFPLLSDQLGLTVVRRLGNGGDDYGSKVTSRSVMILEGPGGVTVVAEKRSGSAGPPSADKTHRLRQAVADTLRSR